MSDGKVTRAEYLAAFNRYAGCMTAAGYPLQAVPDDSIADLLEQLLPLHLTFDQCAAEHP